jgi:2-dehydro-3-deoxyphosphogluconate aldolase/(4S)-4-hydroxy-2-oxoglutarate aldolase
MMHPAFAAMGTCRVVPVLTIARPDDAVPLARALIDGGLRVLEITLRSPGALDAIGAIAHDLPDAIVGAGTVLTSVQADAAVKAGARFLVSPGASDDLLAHARTVPIPWMPGAATPSEVMRLRDRGFSILKFFPAAQFGGVGFLKAVAPLFPDTLFCPTGGVTAGNLAEHLAQPNVLCCGGSWVAPAGAVATRDWPAIAALARAARDVP